MKSIGEINARISELKKSIEQLDAKQQEELKKHYKKRDRRLLLFLNEERKVYTYALTQLEWLLNG